MDMMRALIVAGDGLKAQAARMRLISENIANADSTSETAGGDPYRRKIPVFRAVLDNELGATSVKVSSVRRDNSAFETRIDPGNPAADAQGVVKYPNVNSLVEQMDMREAQRSYEANLNIITATRRMITRTIDILRAEPEARRKISWPSRPMPQHVMLPRRILPLFYLLRLHRGLIFLNLMILLKTVFPVLLKKDSLQISKWQLLPLDKRTWSVL